MVWLEDDDAAFEEEVGAAADNIHAGIAYNVPTPTRIYHSLAFDVNL